MASIEKIKASDGSENAAVATVQNSRSPGSSTIVVDTVDGINSSFMASMGTPHTFVDPETAETITVISEATCVDFSGHIDGANLEIDTIAPGQTDLGSDVDDIVIIRPTTQWADNVASVLEASLDDDGTPLPVSLNPTGIVAPYGGSAAPTGWLLCNGASVLRATYAALFAVIGTTFGSVDGTHFTLPDLRSRLPFGVGTGTWTFSFASTDVNTGTDQITVPAGNEYVTGRKIQLTTTGTLPTGLSLATDYYIIVIDSTHIQLATSESNALFGTAINITGAGSGTNTGTGTLNTYILGQHGGAQKHSHSLSETNAMADINIAASPNQPTMRRVSTKSSFTATHQTNATGSGVSASQNTGAAIQGDTDMTVTVPPYVGLNYIIKT